MFRLGFEFFQNQVPKKLAFFPAGNPKVPVRG
jgi:hypothetical protein